MPIATIVAMKPSLEQSKLFGEQRLVGAAMGAAAAIPILILVGSKHALEVIIILLAGLGIAIKGVNYAYYAAAIACAALIAADLPQPTNYAAEGRRVLFTLIGVGIGAHRDVRGRSAPKALRQDSLTLGPREKRDNNACRRDRSHADW